MVTGVLFLFHGLALASLFVPLSGVFNNQPIIEQDWGLHFHHLESMGAFWRQNRIFWGYNPLFMAGYPSNTIQDLSIKFFEFSALGLSTLGLAPIQWFKILAFLAMAAVPWLMYFAARNLFLRSRRYKERRRAGGGAIGNRLLVELFAERNVFLRHGGLCAGGLCWRLGSDAPIPNRQRFSFVESHSPHLADTGAGHNSPPRSIHCALSAGHHRSPDRPGKHLSAQSRDLDRCGRNFVAACELTLVGYRI